jgi:uncharacterized membrane protein
MLGWFLFMLVVGLVVALFGFVVCLSADDTDDGVAGCVLTIIGAIILVLAFFNLGQMAKTPADMKGRCNANVQLRQYPGQDLSGEASRLRTLLYHNARCDGALTVMVVPPAHAG